MTWQPKTAPGGSMDQTSDSREKVDFSALKILLVGGTPFGVQTLRSVLITAGIKEIEQIATSSSALWRLREKNFSAAFCDDTAEAVDGLKFPLAARRTQGVINPMLPIFLVSSQAYKRVIEKARDDGVTDVLARPISTETVIRKLRTAIEFPRSFIAAPDFFGPDRRSITRTAWSGEDRRKHRAKKVALRIPKMPEAPQLPADEDDDTVLL
jgi:PleD family two-component response regulator